MFFNKILEIPQVGTISFKDIQGLYLVYHGVSPVFMVGYPLLPSGKSNMAIDNPAYLEGLPIENGYFSSQLCLNNDARIASAHK